MIALAVSALCATFGGWLAWHHAIAPAGALAAFSVAAVASFLWPRLWLVALPAAIPVLGFASWTGSMLVDEADLLALAFAAGGYARWGSRRMRATRASGARARPARLSLVAVGLIFFFAVSVAVSLGRGILDAGGLQGDWYAGYYEALNSVRIAKSFALALLLSPLLVSAMRQDTQRPVGLLALGVAAGAGVAALTVVWERMAFTGLLNFSSDYRATGMFWEMHVGGAALDGMLALGVPFVVWAFMHTHGQRAAAAAGLLLLVSYACLTTFSRGVYIAIPISLAVLLLLRLTSGQPGGGTRSRERFLLATKGVLAVAAAALASYLVFRAGGYRSLLAVLGVLAVLLRLSTVVRGVTMMQGVVAVGLGALLSLLGVVTASLAGKGPYIVYALAFAASAAAVMLPPRNAGSAWRTSVTLAAFGWLVFAAVGVALHWGGSAARNDTALVAVALVVLAIVRTRPGDPPWPARIREQGIVVASAAVIAGTVAVMLGGAYMGDRFATSEQDFEGRIQHWRDGLGLLSSPTEWALGKGLGRFPKSYFFGAPDAQIPGSYRIATEDANSFLVLSGPRHPFNFGELFRVAQRVSTIPGQYSLTFDARAPVPAQLHVEICEQQLLYNDACAWPQSKMEIRDPSWHRYVVALDGANLGHASWYAPRLAFFALAVEDLGLRVDIDNVTLVAPDGRSLLDNGEFSRGMARWFMVSEKIHLPWHIKNLAFNVLFDQGAIGLALFTLMVGGALWRLSAGHARGHPLAPFVAAAITGFLVVGAFDSLLDVPRVALVFYLLLITGLALEEPLRTPPVPST